MKGILSLKVIAFGALVVIAAAGNLAAAQKDTQQQKPTTGDEFPFNKEGSVTKHGPDICMAGINSVERGNLARQLRIEDFGIR